jgi:hypothetical protein
MQIFMVSHTFTAVTQEPILKGASLDQEKLD